MPQMPVADPFAHCAAHPELTPRPDMRSMSRAEAATVPRLQPEDFASPLQSGLRYGIMSHISAQTGYSPGSSHQVQKHACVFQWQDLQVMFTSFQCPAVSALEQSQRS